MAMETAMQAQVEEKGAKKAKGEPKKIQVRKMCYIHANYPAKCIRADQCKTCRSLAGKPPYVHPPPKPQKRCFIHGQPEKGVLANRCPTCREIAGKKPLIPKQKKRCPHMKNSYQDCIICYPQAFCFHNKMKRYCRQCKGNRICEHNRVRSTCRQCQGSSICIHGRAKPTCKQCGGSQVCEHNRVRSICVECRGGSICVHQKRRSRCCICNAKELCIHKKLDCSICKPLPVCPHQLKVKCCRICTPSRACLHGLHKVACRVCNGCPHGTLKYLCSQCEGGGRRLCSGCRLYSVSKNGEKCRNCSTAPWHHVSKERVVGNKLIKYANEGLIPLFSSANKKLPRTTLGTGFRPDFYYDMNSFALIVEVDENQHDLAAYNSHCELVRVYSIAQSIGLPLILVRYNPDSLKIGDSATKVPKAERHSLLLAVLREHFSQGTSEFLMVTYLFYDQPAQHMAHQKYAFASTLTYASDLDYEQFVWAAYPEGCTRPPPDAGTKWYSKVD